MLRKRTRALLFTAVLLAAHGCDESDEVEGADGGEAPDVDAGNDETPAGDEDAGNDETPAGDEDAGNDETRAQDAGLDAAPNVCPTVDAIAAAPTFAALDGSVDVSAEASDLEGAEVTFAWSAPAGTFAAEDVASTTYTCVKAGEQILTVTVSDGECTETATVTVTCNGPAATSSQSAYLVPVAEGVLTKPLLTVGDVTLEDAPYTMVGLPDGMGAFDNGDGTFTMISNHEIGASGGVARRHGGTGSFLSRWTVRKNDLGVLSGEDLIQTVNLWKPDSNSYEVETVSLARFCSGDFPAPSAFYDAASGLGTEKRLFLNGEESGAEGRAFAHGLDGVSYELPRVGKCSFENVVASPLAGPKTVVVGLDDSGGGQVYVYVGTKTNAGTVVDRAGLTNGTLYGVAVTGHAAEDSASGIPAGAFSLAELGDVSAKTGAEIQTASEAAGVTAFLRPEDGAWDPQNPSDFYFVTTNSFTAPSRLWRLRFQDAQNPALGGTIEAVLDGSEGQKMLDNLTIDPRGHVIIEEDPGGQDHLAQVWRYDIETDTLTAIAQADPERFAPGAANFLTRDEEHSGVFDATELLGPGWFLANVQAHYALPGQLVEGGQFVAIYDPGSL